MGHHSSEEQWPYYRSLLGWAVPWLLIAAIVGVAVWAAVDFLGQGELEPPRQRARPAGAAAARSPSPTETPSPTQTPTPEETATEEPTGTEGEDRERGPRLVAEGVSVQVLNSTTSSTVSTAMADRLSSLGFDVEAVNPGTGVYPRTTVFWSHAEARRAAEALAARFDWRSGPKPSNLSATVDLHVVIGDDEV